MKHLVLALLVTLPLSAQQQKAPPQRGAGGWWGDLFRASTVALEEVVQQPETWRGRRLSFVVQVQRRGRVRDPFHTRFEESAYISLRCWSESAPLWVRAAYEDVFEHLFLRRGSEVARSMSAAPEYSRWLVTGVVAEVVKGEPWIEAKRARRLKTELDEPSLVNIVKGCLLRDLKRWDAAASAFHAADGATLPQHVRAMIVREEAKALAQGGKKTLAVARLRAAMELIGEDAEARALLARLGGRAGGAPGPDGPRPDPPAPEGGAGGADGNR